MKFYIATSKNQRSRFRIVHEAIRDMGHELTYNWADSIRPPFLDGEHGMCVRATDYRRAIYDADALIAILPGGTGTHIEIGMAMAYRRPVMLLSLPDDKQHLQVNETGNVFYFDPGIVRVEVERDALLHDATTKMVPILGTLMRRK